VASAPVASAVPLPTPIALEAPRPPLVVEPVALHRPAPVYPRLARRAGEEGSVLCRLHLTVEGTVVRVEVLESSGSARLDEAAQEALAAWRFEPRREDGVAVPGTHLHRVTFQLDS
jgi:protein TonB